MKDAKKTLIRYYNPHNKIPNCSERFVCKRILDSGIYLRNDGVINITKTISVNDNEEVWSKLHNYLDNKHLEEFPKIMKNDVNANDSKETAFVPHFPQFGAHLW